MKNIGPVNADPTVTKYNLVSTVDGSKHDLKLPSPEVPTPLLEPGQTFTEQQIVTIRPETAPGPYRLQACADGSQRPRPRRTRTTTARPRRASSR